MPEQPSDPRQPSAVPKTPAGPPPAGPAPAPPRSSRLCENADDACQMCKEMANVRVVRSDELLQGRREMFIIHGSHVYRPLRTRNDKLILQK